MALRCIFFIIGILRHKKKSEATIQPYSKRRASTPCKKNKENRQPHLDVFRVDIRIHTKRASFPHYSVLTL